ncbi:MAG: hypothetical protein VB119_07550 [Candidatus Metalachnospira sp.]|nr:hypothetical protein [Candidatus Metalachnospira sp.]
MIKIIDSTLCMLNDYKLTKEQINRFISLIGNVGIKDLQINSTVYKILEGELPDGFTYYLELGMVPYISGNYPVDEKIKYYFIPKHSNSPKEIETFQINDISEPVDFKSDIDERIIKITGLDGLLISGCDTALAWIEKKLHIRNTIVCPENTYNCATALAVMFLEQKGYAVVTSFSGIGNKAATEQVIMVLHVSERYMNNKRFSDFSKLKIWLEEITEKKVPSSAPIIGERIFYVESGVHVDGILKKPANYEPYPPEEVGLKRKIVLGKYSGKTSVIIKLKKLGLKGYSAEDAEKLLKIIKKQSVLDGTAVSDNKFIQIVEGYDRYEKDTKNC